MVMLMMMMMTMVLMMMMIMMVMMMLLIMIMKMEHVMLMCMTRMMMAMNSRPMRNALKFTAILSVAVLGTVLTGPAVDAQTVCLPLPRLLTTMPMGGTVGTQVEVTITGENLENANELIFTHPGITATPKLDASGQPEANKFLVTIAADCPVGIHEARLMTRLGISSSRVFCVVHMIFT